MKIQKLTTSSEILVLQCDKLFLDFLESESVYDDNYKKIESIKSFFDDLVDENNILLACIEDNNVLGFIYGYIEEKKSSIVSVAHIAFVYVDPKHRNKKIATRLIDTFLKEIKARKIEIVEVKVFDNNKAAKKLYKKYGFDVFWLNYRKRI